MTLTSGLRYGACIPAAGNDPMMCILLRRALWRTRRFFYQLAEENAKKKTAKNDKKTKWVHL